MQMCLQLKNTTSINCKILNFDYAMIYVNSVENDKKNLGLKNCSSILWSYIKERDKEVS